MNEEAESVKKDNRDKILECALKLFYAKGYDAVGVQEIADSAGVTKPTLYYYFKSKYGLLNTLLESKCTKMNRALRGAGEYRGDLPTTLQRTAKVYLSVAGKDKEFYFLLVALYYSARKNESYQAVKPYMIEQFKIIKTIFTQYSDVLENVHGREEQFTIVFMGMLHQYTMVYYERNLKDTDLADDKIVYSLVHQFMYGIYS